MRDLVRRFIDERLHDGHAEIVSALTWELPALVVFEILGVPAADVAAVKQGAANRLQFMFGRAVRGRAGRHRHRHGRRSGATARRSPRTAGHPAQDFTSDLVHTPDQTGVPLTQQEVATILFGLLLAGHETTTNLLGNALRRLLEDSGALGRARRRPGGHPGRRRGGPALRLVRRALAPAHDGAGRRSSGVELPAGADVLVCIGAANRDPEVFARPDEFDLRRANAHQHLSFGSGPHLCLGASLARLEARVVLEELTAALPGAAPAGRTDLRLRADHRLPRSARPPRRVGLTRSASPSPG